jgi:hypothetical protein
MYPYIPEHKPENADPPSSGDKIFVWPPDLNKKRLTPDYKHGDGMKLTGYIWKI